MSDIICKNNNRLRQKISYCTTKLTKQVFRQKLGVIWYISQNTSYVNLAWKPWTIIRLRRVKLIRYSSSAEQNKTYLVSLNRITTICNTICSNVYWKRWNELATIWMNVILKNQFNVTFRTFCSIWDFTSKIKLIQIYNNLYNPYHY